MFHLLNKEAGPRIVTGNQSDMRFVMFTSLQLSDTET